MTSSSYDILLNKTRYFSCGYFSRIYIPSTLPSIPLLTNIEMKISKTRIDISELSDDASQHFRAMGDGVQTDIGQDRTSSPPRHLDNSTHTRAKTYLQFLKSAADCAKDTEALTAVFFAICMMICGIFILVAEIIALFRGTSDFKMIVSVLAMTTVLSVADLRIEGRPRCGCRCG